MGLLEMVGEIEARAEKATRGPWKAEANRTIAARAFDGSWCVVVDKVRGGNPTEGDANHQLIADARTSVPRLCAALRILAEELRFQQDRGNAPAQLALLMAESKLKGETDVHLEFLGDAKTKRRGGVK